jgi:putative SOS response-associated peptidase YedK
MTKKAERYAEHYRLDKEQIKQAKQSHPAVYHVQAFAHPDIPVLTHQEPGRLQFFQWGLIPFWVKDVASANKISNQTLNARGEGIFDKPSFRHSARKKRCIVIADGFFEHHWENGRSYPYYITRKDDSPISLGGLWETWRLDDRDMERNTVSIITTKANDMMDWIHNNPKASQKARMPFIIPDELTDTWRYTGDDPVGIKKIKEMIGPYEAENLKAYPVQRLRGKSYIGNVPEIQQLFNYQDFKNKVFM